MTDSDDGLALEPTIAHPGLSARKTVGPYRLHKLIGGGGMGMVHAAEGPDGEICAIKTLRPDLVDPKAVRRFAREASVRIAHPNVIRVLDDGTDDDGTPYIAFELLEGESLDQRVSRGPIPVLEAITIARSACDGIAAAHAAGVVHRDLKPANIFLCEGGVVKVLDFGIALLPSAQKVTATGIVLGTPAYLSPEQARGTAALDARSDVWAMGAVLYEMLSGSPPFVGESFLEVLVAIALEPVPSLVVRAPHVPAGIVSIVHRCLAKDRDARFADARAVGDALAAFGDPEREAVWEAAAPTMEISRPLSSIPEGEERIVAVVLAEGVRDYQEVEKRIRDKGGEPVTRFRGSVLGLFGGTRWVGDEASRAVDVALEIREFADRVSVASGRALAGGGGRLAGDAVKAAERGCRADLTGVALDSPTAKTVQTRFTLEQIRDGIFEVLTQRPPSWMAPQPVDEEDLFGRDMQVAQMRFALETAVSEGRAMTVQVIGPTGVGKTAMRLELERIIVESDEAFRIVVARAEPLYQESAWSFIASALRRRAVSRGTEAGWPRFDPDSPLERRREVVARLAAEAIDDTEEALRCAEFLGEVLNIPMPESVRLRAARNSPALMIDRIRIAVRDWLVGLAEHGPLALILEDLEWADEASLDVLDQVIEELEESALVLFTSERKPSDTRRPLASHDVVQIKLGGLPRAAIGDLAASLLGRHLSNEMVNVLAERTEGNPLFVRELVLALSEQGKLDGDTIADEPMPLSVEAAVQSRLDLLSTEEKDLCKRASVLGRPFSADTLEAIGINGADILLTALRRRDIVGRHVAGAGRREYRFRSSLVNDVAYKSIAPEGRLALHRRVARHLTTVERGDPEEIARHQDLGGEPDGAAESYADATRAAAARGDSASALRCAGRSLELNVSVSRRYALHMTRAEALRFLGRKDEQFEELAEALSHACDDEQEAMARRQQAFWLCRAGELDEALEVGTVAVMNADDSGEPTVRALSRCSLAQAQIFAGKLEEADVVLREADDLSHDAEPGVKAQVAEWKALSAAMQGDPGRARQAYGLAVELYGEAGNIREKAMNEQNLADAFNRMGAWEEAEKALGQALEDCRRVRNRQAEAYALANLGYALTQAGRIEEALEALADSGRLAEEMKDARLGVAVRIYRARARMVEGAVLEVISEAEAAAEEARKVGLPSLTVTGLSLAARGHLGEGRIDEALELSERALALRDELGGVEEDEAEVFLARVEALEAAQRADEAAAIRDKGRARLLDVADRIGDESLRERFLRGVAAHRALLGEST